MTGTPFDATPIRSEVGDALARRVQAIAAPGAVWTGRQRAAIAAEAAAARTCEVCVQRKQALSPSAVSGSHRSSTDGLLDAAVVDAVHRIATDASRLTKRWYESLIPTSLTDAGYVELVAVVATAVGVRTLADALGVQPPTPPDTAGGAPSGVWSREAKRHTAWVPTVAPEDATGRLAAYYADSARLGFVARITQALSLVPEEQIGFSSLMDVMYLSSARQGSEWAGDQPLPGRALSRPQIELLASTTSRLNECFY